MHARGATILAISEGALANDAPGFHTVRLESGLPTWARAVLYLPLLQLMAYYRALSRNQNPDQPANLEFVISLNDLMISQ
jgi:glucosamine--fructose-6-phosphate aminotransferase (isomerizing)